MMPYGYHMIITWYIGTYVFGYEHYLDVIGSVVELHATMNVRSCKEDVSNISDIN